MYVGFGSNLGDSVKTFYGAGTRLEQRGYRILRTSSLYDTDPWGGAEGGTFLNAVMEVERCHTPQQFLVDLVAVETELGRRRTVHFGARTCDLDLLLWADAVLDSQDLHVPHSGIAHRKFVLVPLCELIADCLHPVLKRTFADLLRTCHDASGVRAHQP